MLLKSYRAIDVELFVRVDSNEDASGVSLIYKQRESKKLDLARAFRH